MQHPIYVSMFLTCPEGISLTSEFSNSDASTPCCSQKLAALGKECVETFAKLRPRFKVIFLRLDELLTPKNAHLFDAGANNDLNYIPFKMPNPGSDEEFQPRSVNEKSFFQYSSFATNGAVPVVASENNNAGEINGGGGKIGNGKTAHVVGSAVEALKRKNTAASKVKPLACCVII